MSKISEREFARIVEGIVDDRETIIKHNPIGTDEEVLLWMLLACLTSYLSLTDIEMPCFNGMPDAKTYRDAINFILENRRTDDFQIAGYLDKLHG
jgi:hypothetical protein